MIEDKKPSAEAPKKFHLTSLNEKGETKVHNMMELNRDAQALQLNAKRRRDAVAKQVKELVIASMKRGA